MSTFVSSAIGHLNCVELITIALAVISTFGIAVIAQRDLVPERKCIK